MGYIPVMLSGTQLCGRPVNPFLSHVFMYKALTLNSVYLLLVTPAMYKGRLEGFSFMSEMDVKQMAVLEKTKLHNGLRIVTIAPL